MQVGLDGGDEAQVSRMDIEEPRRSNTCRMRSLQAAAARIEQAGDASTAAPPEERDFGYLGFCTQTNPMRLGHVTMDIRV